ncbi:hypothetical protein L873DRAFT_1479219 [Choiromyces venosus 120613-1]|uniref:Secreted protein n=1 Tax=Choiromyces venosus 120613-1 TaxID=1336337 RepID=A0A3N4J9R3_9PEZI|nr:hypothetical protein L873DRAFT_1479219 [Choiromyces venosus 120613-1]
MKQLFLIAIGSIITQLFINIPHPATHHDIPSRHNAETPNKEQCSNLQKAQEVEINPSGTTVKPTTKSKQRIQPTKKFPLHYHSISIGQIMGGDASM